MAAFAVSGRSRPDAACTLFFIDPATRDVVQTVYVRRVEKKDGRLFNVEFEKFPDVKDPRD